MDFSINQIKDGKEMDGLPQRTDRQSKYDTAKVIAAIAAASLNSPQIKKKDSDENNDNYDENNVMDGFGEEGVHASTDGSLGTLNVSGYFNQTGFGIYNYNQATKKMKGDHASPIMMSQPSHLQQLVQLQQNLQSNQHTENVSQGNQQLLAQQFQQFQHFQQMQLQQQQNVKLKIGVMSTARISYKFVRAIQLTQSSELIAVASRELSKAVSFCEAAKLPDSVIPMGSYDELINHPDIDAIYLPLPRFVSKYWAVKAARAGKHLILEKPVSLNLSEFEEIVEACKQAGVIVMDGVMFVHHDRTLKLLERLNDSRTGEVLRVSANFSFNANEAFLLNDIRVRKDGDPLGVLGDLGWYCCRFGLYAFGCAEQESTHTQHRYFPDRAIARAHRTSHEGVVTDMDAEIIFASETSSIEKILHFHASFHMPFREDVEIITNKKIIKMHDFVIPDNESCATFTVRHYPSSGQGKLEGSESLMFRDEEVKIFNCRQEVNMIETFSCVVLLESGNQTRESIVHEWIREAATTQAMIDACDESMKRRGEPVKIKRTSITL